MSLTVRAVSTRGDAQRRRSWAGARILFTTTDFTAILALFEARSDRKWAQDRFRKGDFLEIISRMEAEESDYGRWKILRIRIDPDGSLHGSPETEGSDPGRLALATLAAVIATYRETGDTSKSAN